MRAAGIALGPLIWAAVALYWTVLRHRALGAGLRSSRLFVSLEVAVDNEPALSFYKKHGYSVLKVLPRYYLDSIDGLLMGKRL